MSAGFSSCSDTMSAKQPFKTTSRLAGHGHVLHALTCARHRDVPHTWPHRLEQNFDQSQVLKITRLSQQQLAGADASETGHAGVTYHEASLAAHSVQAGHGKLVDRFQSQIGGHVSQRLAHPHVHILFCEAPLLSQPTAAQ